MYIWNDVSGVFRTIFGSNIDIEPRKVPCGTLLIEDEEKEYLESMGLKESGLTTSNSKRLSIS